MDEVIIAERDAALVAVKELVGMLRRTGGFMPYEDQECIWRAEALLASMTTRTPDRDLRHRILALLSRQTEPLTTIEIRELLHAPRSKAAAYHKMCVDLVAEGLMARTGSRRSYRFAIASAPVSSATLAACP